MEYNFADFSGADFDDDREFIDSVLMELACVVTSGNDLNHPSVRQWLIEAGEQEPDKFLLIHKRVVATLHEAMVAGGNARLEELYESGLLPIEKGPEATLHEVTMTIQVMALNPRQAAAMVASHVSYRMPPQFQSAEVDPHAPPDDGDLPGAGPSRELPVPGGEQQ